MLVATYSNSKHIRIYKIEVAWPRQAFVIDHVKTIADCSPTIIEANEDGSASSLPYPEAQLYHLEMIPPGPDIRSKETSPPLLLAFFCNLSAQPDHFALGNDPSPSTSIVRWELTSFKPTLHSSFSQLASKRPSTGNSADLQVCPHVSFGLCITLTLFSQKYSLVDCRQSV